jgi:hypothetical protein
LQKQLSQLSPRVVSNTRLQMSPRPVLHKQSSEYNPADTLRSSYVSFSGMKTIDGLPRQSKLDKLVNEPVSQDINNRRRSEGRQLSVDFARMSERGSVQTSKSGQSSVLKPLNSVQKTKAEHIMWYRQQTFTSGSKEI